MQRCQAVPWRVKLGATGQQGEDTGCGHLVEEQGEQLQRRGIDPVQVFDNEEDGVVRGPLY